MPRGNSMGGGRPGDFGSGPRSGAGHTGPMHPHHASVPKHPVPPRPPKPPVPPTHRPMGLGFSVGVRRPPLPQFHPHHHSHHYATPHRAQLMGEYARRNGLQLGSTLMVTRTVADYLNAVDTVMSYAERVDNRWVSVEVPYELVLIPNTLVRGGDVLELSYHEGLLIATKCPYGPPGSGALCYVYYPL